MRILGRNVGRAGTLALATLSLAAGTLLAEENLVPNSGFDARTYAANGIQSEPLSARIPFEYFGQKPENRGDSQFKSSDAFWVDAAGSGARYLTYRGVKWVTKNWAALTTHYLTDVNLTVVELSDDMINQYVSPLRGRRLADRGMGIVGGTDFQITYDRGQLMANLGGDNAALRLGQNNLTTLLDEKYALPESKITIANAEVATGRAKDVMAITNAGQPDIVTESFNSRSIAFKGGQYIGAAEGLKNRLTEFQSKGVKVGVITMRKPVGKVGGALLNGPAGAIVQYYFLYTAGVDAAMAAYYGVSAVGGHQFDFMKNHCTAYDKSSDQWVGCDSSALGTLAQVLVSSELVMQKVILNDSQK